MMTQVNSFEYMETNRYQAVSLPYSNPDLQMLIVLPQEGVPLHEVEDALTPKAFEQTVAALQMEKVALNLPKFDFRWGTQSLRKMLIELGMRRVFVPSSEHFPHLLLLEGVPPTFPLYIEDVFHQAKIIVDEKGTEAAAATAIVGSATGAPPPGERPKAFHVHRPALFLIYEK